jgi:hypothetical protein
MEYLILLYLCLKELGRAFDESQHILVLKPGIVIPVEFDTIDALAIGALSFG